MIAELEKVQSAYRIIRLILATATTPREILEKVFLYSTLLLIALGSPTAVWYFHKYKLPSSQEYALAGTAWLAQILVLVLSGVPYDFC